MAGRLQLWLLGQAVLAALVTQADGRIAVMGCGALRPDTIGAVRQATGLDEMHFSAQVEEPSAMVYRNAALAMGSAAPSREFVRIGTDPALVRATIAAARA